jgi:hypothetical protein
MLFFAYFFWKQWDEPFRNHLSRAISEPTAR